MKAEVQSLDPVIPTREKKRRFSGQEWFHTKWGLIFLSPWIVGFFAFTLIPIIATLIFSFTNYSPVTPESTVWVGLNNYTTMITDDKVLNSFMVTIKYGLLAIPLSMAFGLLLASLVNSKYLMAKNFFRTIYYMPAMIPVIAAGIIMAGIMNTQTGFINLGLEAVGIPGPDWLNSTFWIYPALVLIGLWGLGNLMITLLAGMQGVSKELYESRGDRRGQRLAAILLHHPAHDFPGDLLQPDFVRHRRLQVLRPGLRAEERDGRAGRRDPFLQPLPL